MDHQTETETNQKRKTMNHVVVMPYPGRGHINPVMNLCHLLSSRFHHNNTLFTIVVTEEWLGLINSDDSKQPENFRFETLPNVIPSELVRGADMLSFLSAVQTEMESPFEHVLDRITEVPVKLIIADAVMKWPFKVGNRRNIPVAAYWPMSASVFSLLYHSDLLDQHNHLFAQVSESGEELIDYIPGLSPMKVADLPNILFSDGRKFEDHIPSMSFLTQNAQYFLFTTIYELEAGAIDALKAKIQQPIFTFGPNIPHFKLHRVTSDTYANKKEAGYLKWLDSKPPRSVLYVSLGSYLSVSSEQMDEIAFGLKESGVKYLWVARGETSRLNDLCGVEGLVVPWCDQLRVLCHSSVGGFWSHCGWNSVKESVFAGVPMLTFPIILDQTSNSKVIVEDWQIGWKVRKEVRMEVLVKREEIAKLVHRFMDSESVERKEMMARVKKLQDICQQTIAEGGSANEDLDSFTRQIDFA